MENTSRTLRELIETTVNLRQAIQYDCCSDSLSQMREHARVIKHNVEGLRFRVARIMRDCDGSDLIDNGSTISYLFGSAVIALSDLNSLIAEVEANSSD
jgi:hypothetical protein